MKRSKSIPVLLLLPLLIGCNSSESRYSEITDLRGLEIVFQNKSDNIFFLINEQEEEVISYSGFAQLPNIAYSHYYDVKDNEYNVKSANHISINLNIITSSLDLIEDNLYFLYEDDGEIERENDVEYSRIYEEDKVIIKLNEIDYHSIRGEQCPYGISLTLNIERKDELKKLQIIECLDEKIIKTTSLTSFTKDFNLLEETETYYLKYTYTDKNGNDYVVDSKFYEASINNLEVYFMGSKGYINNEERYMNIHK